MNLVKHALIKELLDLEKGDIIRLQTKTDEDHKIRTGNRILFTGRSGTLNNHKAIKVTNIILEEKKSL